MVHGYRPGAFACAYLPLRLPLKLRDSIVDVHSHVGVGSAPHLSGAEDGNSLKGTIEAWLRSIDGLNTHDESYALAVAGGVTTYALIYTVLLRWTHSYRSLVLPGSADAIGA